VSHLSVGIAEGHRPIAETPVPLVVIPGVADRFDSAVDEMPAVVGDRVAEKSCTDPTIPRLDESSPCRVKTLADAAGIAVARASEHARWKPRSLRRVPSVWQQTTNDSWSFSV